MKRKTRGYVEKILHENCPSLGNGTSIHVLEVEQPLPNIIESRKTSRHLIVRMRNHNCKQDPLKAARIKKLLTYRGKPTRITVGSRGLG